jgi:hypothetical protein
VSDGMKLQIDKAFNYHAPKDGQPEKYNKLRQTAKELAWLITDLTPESREQSLAITNLEQVVMWANAAIARNESSE